MPTSAVAAVAGGALSALPYMLLAQGALGAVVLAYFSQLPLFAVGLSFGLQAGAIAALVGMVGVGVVAGLEAAVIFGAGNAVPVTMLLRAGTRQARLSGAPHLDIGAMVMTGTGMAVVGYLAAAMVFSGTPDGLQGVIREQLMQVAVLIGGDANDQIAHALEARATDFPAFVGASWVLMLAVNLMLAQRLMQRTGMAHHPAPDYRGLSVPEWLWIPVGISGLMMILGGEALGFHGRNLFALCALPFFFQGLATIHLIAGRLPQKTFLLTLFYFILLWFLWHALFLVAVLGLIDQWTDLRQRRGAPSGKPEDE